MLNNVPPLPYNDSCGFEDELKPLVDEIRYQFYGVYLGKEIIIKKNEVSEDEWNQNINNLIFDIDNSPDEGMHCRLYCKDLEVFSGMLSWDWFKR